MLLILAILVAVVAGAVAHASLLRYSPLVRLAGAIAGAIVGFWATYYLAHRA